MDIENKYPRKAKPALRRRQTRNTGAFVERGRPKVGGGSSQISDLTPALSRGEGEGQKMIDRSELDLTPEFLHSSAQGFRV